VTLCYWMSGSWCFKGTQCFPLQGSGSPRTANMEILWGAWPLKMKAMPSFKTAGTTYQTIQGHVCEALKPQLQHCWDPKNSYRKAEVQKFSKNLGTTIQTFTVQDIKHPESVHTCNTGSVHIISVYSPLFCPLFLC